MYQKNLKIYITLRDVYLRSFDNFLSTEISNTNLEFKISNLVDLRKHLYQKVNRPIILNNCKIFIRNKNNEVIINLKFFIVICLTLPQFFLTQNY